MARTKYENAVKGVELRHVSPLYKGGDSYIVNKWESVDHPRGEYPYAAIAHMWRHGMIPAYDGDLWGLYAGEMFDPIWIEPEKDWIRRNHEAL